MLNRNLFLIKERVGFMKLSDIYDIFDPENGYRIGIAREKPGRLVLLSRLFANKRSLPTRIIVYEEKSQRIIFSIKKGFTIFESYINIIDCDNNMIGYLENKLFSLGGGFYIYDNNNMQIAEIKGDWKGWNFQFILKDGTQAGTVTKKWAGLGKELFTSADNYIVSINKNERNQITYNALLLAACLAIDIVYKER